MRVGRLVTVAFASMALVLGSGTAALAATTAKTYNTWTWNVSGWVMHRGSTTDGLIPALTASIQNRSVNFAALNEVCWSQYKAVQSRLAAAGWPQDTSNFSRFAESTSTACNGEAFGNAIFSKAPLGGASRFTLPSDGTTEYRNLLCAPLSATPNLRFCTTHITTSSEVINGTPINVQQLNYVLAQLEGYNSAGQTVLIAGDFNAQPNYGRLNNWYSSSLNVSNNSGNTGHYREVDDTDTRCLGYGETTVADGDTGGPCGLGAKIDLTFVRENRIAGAYTGDSLAISTSCGGPCSDHRILIGTVTVYVTA